MGDAGNARGRVLGLTVLTSSVMAAVAVLLGLEAMSWVAAGIAVVLGVIALFSGPTGTGGGGFRLPAGRGQQAMLVGAAIVLGGAVALRAVVNPAGSGADPAGSTAGPTAPEVKPTAPKATTCPKPPDPTTRAVLTSTPSASYPGLGIKSMIYSLTYNGEDFMHLEMTGQITGEVPDDHLLYPFGSADPRTRDAYGNAGSDHLFWGKDELIEPDPDGCWSKPRRQFGGYPGARGLTFRYHLGLVPQSRLSCLSALVSTKKGQDHGQEPKELARCGITLLGYAHIPTDPL
ncbi:hypothetical protein [Nonomuraea sp. NPDC050643]|uniref:hypothetical protein n=1 Tax=Nonomuraea sp. NPDC050643 TaxID=3155660 RepID=UPI0033EA1F21